MCLREWGDGEPLIALHPLGLESSAFADLGGWLAEDGIRTIAADLPGFGRTEAPGGPLTPARLAEPVIEMAARMEPRPWLLGYSMGGRVALECLLTQPEAFRSAILIAPHLPWLRLRWATPLARLMSPELAMRIPVETLWPVLKWIAHKLQTLPRVRDDSVAQAGVRLIYYLSCPATRYSLISAAREMALDPAYGPQGVWSRLPSLEVPTTFLWGERDRLVPIRFAYRVAKTAPQAYQYSLPCVRHALNGPHARCLASLVASILVGRELEPAPRWEPGRPFDTAPCHLESDKSSHAVRRKEAALSPGVHDA